MYIRLIASYGQNYNFDGKDRYESIVQVKSANEENERIYSPLSGWIQTWGMKRFKQIKNKDSADSLGGIT